MITYNNKVLNINNKWMYAAHAAIRVKYKQGTSPHSYVGNDRVLVDQENNIWDIYKAGTKLNGLFMWESDLLEVISAKLVGIVDMGNMFYGCSSLTSVPLFDTSNVTSTYEMFRGCSNLTSSPLFDTRNVTNMGDMFYGCSSLTSVPLFDTSSCTNMDSMFYGCASLTSIPLFDTSNVTTTYQMFRGCSNLTSSPLFDTGNATNISEMFQDCTSLTAVPLFDTAKALDMKYMFANCPNVESGALALYQQASSQSRVPTHRYCFYNCGSNTTTGAAELAQIPSGWQGWSV
jgi:surface protein